MPQKIGIPRTLGYYTYYPLWKTFFEELGLEVITSSPTSKTILDAGVKEAVNDACIPIKILHGHVIDLKGKVDYIFLPRLVSVRKFGTETFCPKFLGLPDMVRAAIADLPEIIDTRVDLAKGRFELLRLCCKMGERFGASLPRVIRAYWRALMVYRQYQRLLRERYTPVEAIEILDGRQPESQDSPKKSLVFAVLGYPYAVYDNYLNVNLLKRLRGLGVRILTAEMIPTRLLIREAKKLPKNLFWHFSNRAVQAAWYFLYRERVDGIVHVTAFGCGPDAMVDRMIELEAKNNGHRPFLSLTIDEHTGEAGIQTRVEAFVDMLKLRRGVL